MRIMISVTVLATVSLLAVGIFCGARADDDRPGKWRHHDGRGFHRGHDHAQRHHREKHLKPVTNDAYKETCGACHFAYQPGLLPSASWNKVLGNLHDHFGHAVEIDEKSRESIGKYLVDNAAEHSSAKPSVRIMKCLRGRYPDRITQVPYILRTHSAIPSEVFARKAVGSLSNCSACHKAAAQGVYEDGDVAIPR
jgi:hypothetical protein